MKKGRVASNSAPPDARPSAERRAARRRAAAALDRQQRPTGRQLILSALVLIYSLVVTSWLALAPGLGQLTVPAMIYAGAITAMTASTVFAGFSRLGLTTSCRPMLSCSASGRWDDDRAEVPSLPAGDLAGRDRRAGRRSCGQGATETAFRSGTRSAARSRRIAEDLAEGAHMNAETETAIQNLSKAFADTGDLVSAMKQIAKSLVNIELHLQAMRPSNVQTVRGPIR